MSKKIKSAHTIPGPVSYSALKKAVIKQPEYEERSIREYVELEAIGEKVLHLEKLVTEHLLDRSLDAWDVRTDKERYWVITSPTNLYSQKDFPSLDYTLSFHIGVTMRVMARNSRKAPDERPSQLEPAWRLWEQAAEAQNLAKEAVDFQTVGMRCRECVLVLIKAISSKDMIPKGQKAPKAGDFLQWAELIANTIARGSSAEEIRGYLKSMSKSTWQLVNWLTHSSNAVLFDGMLAVDAVEMLLSVFGTILIRYKTGIPNKCPNCSSYRLISDYRPDLKIDPPYVILCETCGWTDYNSDSLDTARGQSSP
jgi:hypothetical protein